MDENSGADMRALLNGLDLLSREFGVSWPVVHHYHKPSALAGHRTGGQQLRGSSVLVRYTAPQGAGKLAQRW
ncbi:MAG: hypothetical protein AB1446_03070 [Bacillota bacterium]